MGKTTRALKGDVGLGLNPRAFIRAVRWQLEDVRYPPSVLAQMSPAELAVLSRFNREFHGGRYAGAGEGTDLLDSQVLRRERWNAKDCAERDVMSVWQYAGDATPEMQGTYNPFQD